MKKSVRTLCLICSAIIIAGLVSACEATQADSFERFADMVIISAAILSIAVLAMVAVMLQRSRTQESLLARLIEKDYEYSKKLSEALAAITKSEAISAGSAEDAAIVIATQGARALNCDRISVWGGAESLDTFSNLSCYDKRKGQLLSLGDRDLSGREAYARLLKSERLVVTNDAEKAQSMVIPTSPEFGQNLRAVLDAPIRVDGILAGVVCAELDDRDEGCGNFKWRLEEQNFVSSLADLMALAILGAERREASEAAKRANRIKSTFLANMSHEIRTPMNSIVGFSELAMYDDIAPKTRDYLRKILENSQWLLLMIKDILDISKIESGKMELESIPFDICDMFDACETSIMPMIVEKGLSFECKADAAISKKLLGDPTRLRQAIMNLLTNAAKFTQEGTVTVSAKVISQLGEVISIRFEVNDSGIGMSEGQIKKVFEPFEQAEPGTTRMFGGTGLGLPISKSIVEQMGGRLDVSSVLGKGTNISFELNFEMVTIDEDLVEPDFMFADDKKPIFRGEVLLCEDNRMNREVFCEHLQRIGLDIVVAENGAEGVQEVCTRLEKRKPPFDLIFMDIHMPVLDGIEATAQLIKMDIKTPIIAMTANVVSQDIEIYKSSGMSDFIGKPFTSKEMWLCLMKYLEPVGWSDIGANVQSRDTELKNMLMGVFLRENSDRVCEIEAAIKLGDIKLAHRMAHNLKSNAGQLGKKELQEIAGMIEKLLEDGVSNVTSSQLENLKKELDNVIGEFSATGETQQEPSNAVSTLTALETEQLYNDLLPLLESGDARSLEFTEKIRGIKSVKHIARLIEDIELEHAAAELRRIMQDGGRE